MEDESKWTYQEFLAFLLVYGAHIKLLLTPQELAFIKTRTGVDDIEKIRAKVEGVTDIEAIEFIESCCKRFLDTEDKEEKVRHDLEDLLKNSGQQSQMEKVVVHILERLI